MELICEQLRSSLKENFNISTLTPVQERCIPEFLNYKDVLVQAPTGSGKTFAYLLPTMQLLLKTKCKKHQIGAVVLVPNRELGRQVAEVARRLTTGSLSVVAFIGGTALHSDVDCFNAHGGNIVIATPGRLEDLVSECDLNLVRRLKTVEVLVLDEADRFVEAGFRNSVSSILKALPKQRRTVLFSATQAKDMEDLVKFGMRNPLRITVSSESAGVMEAGGGVLNNQEGSVLPDSLKAFYAIVPAESKLSTLIEFLKSEVGTNKKKVLVFFSTCACVDYFGRILGAKLQGVSICTIHGKKRAKRQKLFERFQKMTSGAMLCTDVMSRGIDVPDIDWVVQFDPPKRSSWFVHRSGRSGRLGRIGSCLVLLCPSEEGYVEFLATHEHVPLERIAETTFKGTTSEDGIDMMNKVRVMASKDRALLEKGSQAFVSYIQAYNKHDCDVVCSLKELDIVNSVHCYGLLRLPRMPELCRRDLSAFIRCDKNTADIKYKDKAKEKARQLSRSEGKLSNKRLRKEELQKELPTTEKPTNKRKRSVVDLIDQMDNTPDDFGDDYRLIEKLKKGKISQEQFDRNFGEHSD